MPTLPRRGWQIDHPLRGLSTSFIEFEVQPKLLKGNYIGDHVESILGLIEGMLGVQTIAHLGA